MTDTDNVVKTEDVAPKKQPKSFNDLNVEQLRAAAQVFGSDDSGNKQKIKAALVEDGVTWDMYARQFKLDGYESEPEEPVTWHREDDFEEGVEEVEEKVVTVDPNPVLPVADKYLIKMTRKNPYFEFGRYRFTQERPYAIMSAKDAQRILSTEQGFRQAFPEELQDFYS